jgi:CubicO group peptidase (beta-lactamase class C family)
VVRDFTRQGRLGHGLGWQTPANAPPGSFAHGGFTGTYVLAVPRHRLALVLLTNRQNVGTDTAGYYADLRALQRGVVEAFLSAAAREDTDS